MWGSKTTITQPECILLLLNLHTLPDVWKASSLVRYLFYNCHTLPKEFLHPRTLFWNIRLAFANLCIQKRARQQEKEYCVSCSLGIVSVICSSHCSWDCNFCSWGDCKWPWASSFLFVVLISWAERWHHYDAPPLYCSGHSIRFLWLYRPIYSCTHNYPFNLFI